jgi:hypothetical protein
VASEIWKRTNKDKAAAPIKGGAHPHNSQKKKKKKKWNRLSSCRPTNILTGSRFAGPRTLGPNPKPWGQAKADQSGSDVVSAFRLSEVGSYDKASDQRFNVRQTPQPQPPSQAQLRGWEDRGGTAKRILWLGLESSEVLAVSFPFTSCRYIKICID